MKIILDCNVIISAGLSDGNCRKVLFRVLQNHTLYVSKEILIEYKAVISRPKFKGVYNYLYRLIENVCEIAELIQPTKCKFVLPDRDDLIYLEAALSARAEFLITGNIKDFPCRKYQLTRIITPKDFLDLELETTCI